LFIPGGPLRGRGAIKPFFQGLISEFFKPGAAFSLRQQNADGDYAYILWTAETADNTYEAATDTFIVRNGKIVAQSFAAKITPKRCMTIPGLGKRYAGKAGTLWSV
jgi:SnoaL-like domain